MSIFIKIGDVRLPSRCKDCEMFINEGMCCSIDGDFRYAYSKRNCPVIKLPDKHGRLIDGDRVEKILSYSIKLLEQTPALTTIAKVYKDVILEEIKKEKTIIEAEGER